ncbi:hypothetical protein [Micromonospora aurantiaca (nom. illeg.)]|uniref:hypothetical protein n=1 Tax=Micromonospora aurantiaca (nom. illeg.) TaxID=47850 RepID=UPI00344A53C2
MTGHRADFLTRAEVAALTGTSHKHVRGWCLRRGIRSTRIPGDQRAYYPAAPIFAVISPPLLGLARFIRNPLNR